MSTYNRDGATITVTPSSTWTGLEKTLTNQQISSGFNSNLDTVSFNGSIRRGRPTIIASVLVTADSDKYFSTPPYLQTKTRGLSLRLRNKVNQRLTVGDGVFFTSYTYDLLFTSNGQHPSSSALNVNIKYITKAIPTISAEIYDVNFGGRILSSSGETRLIKVAGTKGAVFGLAINENVESLITLSDGDAATSDEIVEIIDKANDTSILPTAKYKTNYNYGKKIPIIRGTIPSSGVFEFSQSFPSVIVKATKVNGSMAASGATKIIFDNLTGVKVGDRIYSAGIPMTTASKVVTLNPDNDNVNECTLDTSVTLADNTSVEFKRARSYSIDIIPSLTSTLGSKIPTTDPEYRLHQYLDTTLTITHSITGTDLTITKFNDVATDLARGAEHILTYSGRANTINTGDNDTSPPEYGSTKMFSVKLEISCVPASGPAHTFTAKTTPIFSSKERKIHPKKSDGSNNTNAVVSNWTNSIAKSNGGTAVSITGIRFTPTGSATINLFYNVEILKWGTRNVDMELDLDTILTNA
tara:strand:+ start:9078 stop:10655 length:1578 start_codon:yes stop_codon:yes gene_type:complete